MNLDDCVAGVTAGSRADLGRAITLVESTAPADREAARALLARLAPYAGKAHRIGISGVPGAGKSTLIDALGSLLTDRQHRVAVLAVDPSSERTGGSILGDATRMSRLAGRPGAYVRASPSAGARGGTGPATRAAITVVEAAGYDVVLVETVGVGQTEAAVATMVDTFVLLALIGAGDQLQGIKMGTLEFADVVVVNKADGPRVTAGKNTARELSAALRLLPAGADRPAPRVMTCSATEGTGVAELWEHVADRFRGRTASGKLTRRRGDQDVQAMWSSAYAMLADAFTTDAGTAARAAALGARVADGSATASDAARLLVHSFFSDSHDEPGGTMNHIDLDVCRRKA
jgi:LAO/AO transport system kinase